MEQSSSKRVHETINNYYNGHVDAYKKDMAEKTSGAIRWNDIRAHALTLPEYEEEALRQIEFQLGYLPDRNITLPYEPFIRYALYRYDYFHKNFDRLCAECAEFFR